MVSIQLALALAFTLAACAGDRADPPSFATDEQLERHDTRVSPRPPPPRFDRPTVARYHMQQNFSDLRMLERLLLAGKLKDATTLAYLLVRQPDQPIAPSLDDGLRRVSDAACALTKATTLDEALRREVQIAAACADCHVQAQVRPVFAALPALPRDAPTVAARMRHHVWATDRLWEGLVGPNDARWEQGLVVLADAEPPVASLAGEQRREARLQELARKQLELPPSRATSTTAARATAYGEILVTCVGCHESLQARLP
jgi:cytochrome c553